MTGGGGGVINFKTCQASHSGSIKMFLDHAFPLFERDVMQMSTIQFPIVDDVQWLRKL